MALNPAERIAKGITPYDYKDPNRKPLAPRMIQATRVVEALDRAGFPQSEWVTGVAIARRESSFVPDLIGAVNYTSRDYDPVNASWDFGLFQISFKWNSHLMEGEKKIGEWDDPDDNARMAKYLFDESVRRGYEGWRPWHTYTSGNYSAYLDLAEEAVEDYKESSTYTALRRPPEPAPIAPTPAPAPSASTPVRGYVSFTLESQATVGISPTGSSANTTHGVVIHHPGASTLTLGNHETCRSQVRNWDAQHRRQGWSGLGYNFALCHHGVLMTGRGLRRQGAHAPGANTTHIGLLVMVANNKRMTRDQRQGLIDSLMWLETQGVNSGNTSPHSQWIATTCPGDLLRQDIRDGVWRVDDGSSTPAPSNPAPVSGGMTSVRSVEYQQKAVNAAGYSPALTVDNTWGPKTEAGVKWYQRKLGVTADGKWGSATDAAHQKQSSKEDTPVPTPKKKVTVDGILGRETISELQRALNEGRF